ncbi:MAG: hypothetical protein KGL57_00925 [Burkholderiales bacterium]|nr:hypothetical protein [Burkholderiales bacterium]
MITYQSRQGWRRPWVGALLVGALLVGALVGATAWWWLTRADESVPARVEPGRPASWPAVAAGPKLVESALVTPPPVLADGRPADFTPEDWAALKEAMAKTPNPKAETERVLKYLRFQRGFEQWQSLKGSPDVAHRQELAKRLLEQVPERLRQGEASMGEALMLATALWTDLEPNEDLRKQRIDEAKNILINAAPKPDAEQVAQDASRLTEYKRREAAIVADWQAKPAAQRDQAKLEEALESARRAVYARDKN